jgi:pantoate--beta-alanine ligase
MRWILIMMRFARRFIQTLKGIVTNNINGDTMAAVIKSIAEWQSSRKKINGKSVGLVPTMGNLHDGHMSLIRQSQLDNEVTVVSSFVNPTQFNAESDLAAYPQTPEDDYALMESAGVDYIFRPNFQDMYPDQYHYKVSEVNVSRIMEGEQRPGHFDGVLTVVLKLLMLFKPNYVYFGEKDFQQLELVKGMAEAFFLDTIVKACPIVRNPFGLALSSRNRRLSDQQLKKAQLFFQHLQSNRACDQIKGLLSQAGFKVDYITEFQGRRYGAVFLGDVRLIDNVEMVLC